MIYSRLQINHRERVNGIILALHRMIKIREQKSAGTVMTRGPSGYDRRPLTVKETTNRQPAIGLEFGLTADTGSR